MREFPIVVKDELRLGLRPDARNKHGFNYLTQCDGLKVSEFGIVAEPTLVNPFSAQQYEDNGIVEEWPFPQLFVGGKYTFLADKTRIFLVDNESLELNQIVTYDASDIDELRSIPSGGPWHFVDLVDSFLFLNGSCAVFRTSNDEKGVPDRVYVQDRNTVETACYYKGRVIYAGFCEDETHAVWDTLGESVVAWTSVNAGDAYYQFMPVLVPADLKKEYFLRNDMGYTTMPFAGSIQHIRVLGENVIVYGKTGIAVLKAVFDPVRGFGMISTMGVSQIASFGVPCRGAVGGDETRHVFVDENGYLYNLDQQLNLTRIGYKEFFADLVCKEIVISYEPEEQDFFIACEDVCYLLSRTGLSKVSQAPTSLTHTETEILAIYRNDDLESTFVTDTFDMELNYLKFIQFAELSYDGIVSAEVRVHYRYAPNDAFLTSEWMSINSVGWANIAKSALHFRLQYRGTFGADARVHSAKIGWKLIDKRAVRGPYGVSQSTT